LDVHAYEARQAKIGFKYCSRLTKEKFGNSGDNSKKITIQLAVAPA